MRNRRVNSAHAAARPGPVQAGAATSESVALPDHVCQPSTLRNATAADGSALEQQAAPHVPASPRPHPASAPPTWKQQGRAECDATTQAASARAEDRIDAAVTAHTAAAAPLKPRLTRSTAAADPPQGDARPPGLQAVKAPVRVLPQRQGLHTPRSPRVSSAPGSQLASPTESASAQDDASPMDIDSEVPNATAASGSSPGTSLRVDVPSPRGSSRDLQSPRTAKAVWSPSGRKTRSGDFISPALVCLLNVQLVHKGQSICILPTLLTAFTAHLLSHASTVDSMHAAEQRRRR